MFFFCATQVDAAKLAQFDPSSVELANMGLVEIENLFVLVEIFHWCCLGAISKKLAASRPFFLVPLICGCFRTPNEHDINTSLFVVEDSSYRLTSRFKLKKDLDRAIC
ncbi:hypothetical protein Y032_0042g580 [Ancylostoma ceylanicum]|uniref:Uncharacterized protein n=1 Tax=Ancylostoma ceylanicum TaxID=53326 RepID=A0A016UEZ2_9BILA|nr:hypothetical protein Y032_0042g580 [Ancylostoma ceylanicum]